MVGCASLQKFVQFYCLLWFLVVTGAVVQPAQAQIEDLVEPALLNANGISDEGGDQVPIVVTDREGHWVTVWSSYENLNGTAGGNFDIFVSTSADNGSTWTPTALLNSSGTDENGWGQSPHIATDGAGNWVTVWYSGENLDGQVGTDWDIFVAASTNDGASWTPNELLNSNAGPDSGQDQEPSIATDGNGNWVVVWASKEDLGGSAGDDEDIFVARSWDNGSNWSPPELLNANANFDSGDDLVPQVATDGVGHWVAVWSSPEDITGTSGTDWDAFVSRSTDNGVTWTFPELLNVNGTTDGNGETRPQVATDGAGHWLAVWYSTENLNGTAGYDEDIFVTRSSDNGITWTYPELLNTNGNTDSGGDWQVHVASGGAGNWVAVWSSEEDLNDTAGTDADIFMATSTDDGVTWTAPALANTNGDSDEGGDDNPDVESDGAGNWMIVWSSKNNLNSGANIDYDIHFTTFYFPFTNVFQSQDFSEIFSNGDGTIQFIEVSTLFDSQHLLEGNWLTSNTDVFAFPTDLPSSSTANRPWIMATAGFEALPGAVVPDFIMPDNFFSPSGDTLTLVGGDFSPMVFGHGDLPLDGVRSLNKDLTTGVNSPTNFNGDAGSIRFDTITVLSPNGGEPLVIGTPEAITWNTTGTLGGNVGILLRSPRRVEVISDSTSNDGSFDWTPAITTLPGFDYRVFIRSLVNPSVGDMSDRRFSIGFPSDLASIGVLFPNGGETLIKASTETIVWESSGPIDTVSIVLLMGELQLFIAKATPNDGMFEWVIPQFLPELSNYRIRVQLATGLNVFDSSDGPFAVAATLSR